MLSLTLLVEAKGQLVGKHVEYLGWEIELVAEAETNEGQVWVVEL